MFALKIFVQISGMVSHNKHVWQWRRYMCEKNVYAALKHGMIIMVTYEHYQIISLIQIVYIGLIFW